MIGHVHTCPYMYRVLIATHLSFVCFTGFISKQGPLQSKQQTFWVPGKFQFGGIILNVEGKKMWCFRFVNAGTPLGSREFAPCI